MSDKQWIEWAGGKMPVERGIMVDVRCRNGRIHRGIEAGTGWAEDWDRDNVGADIVAYRWHCPDPIQEKATSGQVGGDHYKSLAIQPIEYITKNKLPYMEGNVIKYVTRHRYKNGAEDIRKAIHFLQMILEVDYGE